MTPRQIKEYRIAKNMTQARLGELCGVKKSSVSQWESGSTVPSGKAKMELEKLLNGDQAVLPLSPVEQRLMAQLIQIRKAKDRTKLLEQLVLESLRRDDA